MSDDIKGAGILFFTEHIRNYNLKNYMIEEYQNALEKENKRAKYIVALKTLKG